MSRSTPEFTSYTVVVRLFQALSWVCWQGARSLFVSMNMFSLQHAVPLKGYLYIQIVWLPLCFFFRNWEKDPIVFKRRAKVCFRNKQEGVTPNTTSGRGM